MSVASTGMRVGASTKKSTRPRRSPTTFSACWRGGRPQVDPIEVERSEPRERARRRLGHPDVPGAVDRVEHGRDERADLARLAAPDDVGDLRRAARRAGGCPARTASVKSWLTYAIRSAHATTSPSGVDGAGRRHEWLRTPSSVSTQRLSGASVTSAPYTAWS